MGELSNWNLNVITDVCEGQNIYNYHSTIITEAMIQMYGSINAKNGTFYVWNKSLIKHEAPQHNCLVVVVLITLSHTDI